MERLLHYVWKHKLFPLKQLLTTQGEEVEVIDPGLLNTDAGPDFFNSKVKIGGTLWVGNVEIHQKSSDWYAHGHDKDPLYDNVVLHVTGQADRPVLTSQGKQPPQLELPVPEEVQRNYAELLCTDTYPPCFRVIPTLSKLTVHSFLSRMTAERLERKRREVRQRLALSGGDWEQTLFVTLARSFGFGLNSSAFEAWAQSVPLSAAAHHRDSPLQIEALFMGQAGFLDVENLPRSQRDKAASDPYFLSLKREYAFLARKFGLIQMPAGQWRWLRLRPHNFPYIRIAQLAELYCSRRCSFSVILESLNADTLRAALRTGTTPYWERHSTFGTPCEPSTKVLTSASVDSLLINAVAPVLSAYAGHRHDERLSQRAASLLEALPAERNSIVSTWKECGLEVKTAADSQALIQLKRCYCDKRDCLRCRFGYEALRSKSQQSANSATN